VVNYNFFPSLVTCKALVGLWISPGLPLRKTGLMGKKTTSSLALQGVRRRVSPEEEKKEDQGKLRCTILKSKKGKI
jgi:hypothetical protein